MKKIFIQIPEDIHRAAKLEAVASGVTLKDYIAQAVKEKTEKGGKPSKN